MRPFRPTSPAVAALAIAAVAAATLAGAFAFQFAGYAPCELCLQERLPYYAGVALALVVALVAATRHPAAGRAGLWLLALLFLASTALGAYHAGVEWGFWPGPTGCTGAIAAPPKVGDFLKSLSSVRVVRCDAVAIRVAGLSLADYNALVSLALAVFAGWVARRGVAARALI